MASWYDTVSDAVGSAADSVSDMFTSAPAVAAPAVAASGAATTGGTNLADSFVAIPSVLSRAADALAAKLIPAADSLLMAFAVIMLVWVGIRMMLEKNQHDQAIIGDAIKLLLLLGVAKALLANHSYLVSLLQQSTDFLCQQMGIDPRKIYTSMFKLMIYDPAKTISNSMPNIMGTGAPESEGILDIVKTAFSNFGEMIVNLIPYVLTILLFGFLGWTAIAVALSALLMIMFPEVLLSFIASLGVVCIPFLVLPKLDKIFWSWIDGMIYAIMCKLTVVGSTALIAALFTANIGEMTIPIDGLNYPNLGTMIGVVINITIAYAIVKMSYQLAGILAGTRLALQPEIALPKMKG